MEEIKGFSKEVQKELKYYVYKLIDPRNGQVFYVGKGTGDRVFQHMKDELTCNEDEDALNLKLSIIRQIRSLGLSVISVIHRHGMNQETAFEVEAALIDAIPGLTNIQAGHGNSERGCCSIRDLITKYQAPTVDFDEKVIVVKIKQQTIDQNDGNVYEAGRKWWRLNLENAQKAELAIISVQGLIKGVYEDLKWEKCPDKDIKRIGFTGKEASKEIRDMYIGKRLSESMLKAQNPILYSWDNNKK